MHNGKPEPKDAWTRLVMTGTLNLIKSSTSEFALLDPIVSKDDEKVYNESVSNFPAFFSSQQ